jgi:hypothetical protein
MVLFLFFTFTLIDAEWTKSLIQITDTAWETLGNETVPPEQQQKMLLSLMNRLAHTVPRSFLKENVVPENAAEVPPERGQAAALKGTVLLVTKFSEEPISYRCRMNIGNNLEVDVLTPAIPAAWKLNEPIRERAAAWGICVQPALFVVPTIQWFPNTLLGNLGFDVASLDNVPILRVSELEKNDPETIRRAFKFTELDREPFYGLLKATSATPAGWLEQEARKLGKMPTTELFNNPQGMQGKPVLLHGTAKRIIPTPVEDAEIKSLFGIKQYYQIYLFTDDSQGNPLVVCVSSLPEGMPTGDAADFAEEMTVAAIPYKLWIYETASKPHYAPLLVGRRPIWHPKPIPQQEKPPETVTTFSMILFFVLMCAWFFARHYFRRKIPK